MTRDSFPKIRIDPALSPLAQRLEKDEEAGEEMGIQEGSARELAEALANAEEVVFSPEVVAQLRAEGLDPETFIADLMKEGGKQH